MSKKKKPKPENKTDWAFTPKLGYEIEPELNESEIENILTRLVKPGPIGERVGHALARVQMWRASSLGE